MGGGGHNWTYYAVKNTKFLTLSEINIRTRTRDNLRIFALFGYRSKTIFLLYSIQVESALKAFRL